MQITEKQLESYFTQRGTSFANMKLETQNDTIGKIATFLGLACAIKVEDEGKSKTVYLKPSALASFRKAIERESSSLAYNWQERKLLTKFLVEAVRVNANAIELKEPLKLNERDVQRFQGLMDNLDPECDYKISLNKTGMDVEEFIGSLKANNQKSEKVIDGLKKLLLKEINDENKLNVDTQQDSSSVGNSISEDDIKNKYEWAANSKMNTLLLGGETIMKDRFDKILKKSFDPNDLQNDVHSFIANMNRILTADEKPGVSSGNWEKGVQFFKALPDEYQTLVLVAAKNLKGYENVHNNLKQYAVGTKE